MLLVGLITEGGGDWGAIFLMLFRVPFVLIGLVLLGGVVYMFMALFNPRFEVAMSRGDVQAAGQTAFQNAAGNIRDALADLYDQFASGRFNETLSGTSIN